MIKLIKKWLFHGGFQTEYGIFDMIRLIFMVCRRNCRGPEGTILFFKDICWYFLLFLPFFGILKQEIKE